MRSATRYGGAEGQREVAIACGLCYDSMGQRTLNNVRLYVCYDICMLCIYKYKYIRQLQRLALQRRPVFHCLQSSNLASRHF